MINWRVRTLRLPHEIFNKHRKVQRVVIGDLISVEEQEQFTDLKSFGDFLRSRVYELKAPGTMVSGEEFVAAHRLPGEESRECSR